MLGAVFAEDADAYLCFFPSIRLHEKRHPPRRSLFALTDSRMALFKEDSRVSMMNVKDIVREAEMKFLKQAYELAAPKPVIRCVFLFLLLLLIACSTLIDVSLCPHSLLESDMYFLSLFDLTNCFFRSPQTIPLQSVTAFDKIGEGYFSIVYEGYLRGAHGIPDYTRVALKVQYQSVMMRLTYWYSRRIVGVFMIMRSNYLNLKESFRICISFPFACHFIVIFSACDPMPKSSVLLISSMSCS